MQNSKYAQTNYFSCNWHFYPDPRFYSWRITWPSHIQVILANSNEKLGPDSLPVLQSLFFPVPVTGVCTMAICPDVFWEVKFSTLLFNHLLKRLNLAHTYIDGEVCAPGLHGLSCLPRPFSHNLFACPSPFSILLHLFLCFSLTSCPPTNSPHIHAIYWTHSECQLYTSYEDVAFGLQELSNKGPASSRWGQKFQPWTKPLSLKRTFPLRKPNPQAPKTRNPKIILSLNHLTLNLIHHLA